MNYRETKEFVDEFLSNLSKELADEGDVATTQADKALSQQYKAIHNARSHHLNSMARVANHMRVHCK